MHDAKVATEGYFPLWRRAAVKDDKDWDGILWVIFLASLKSLKKLFGRILVDTGKLVLKGL